MIGMVIIMVLLSLISTSTSFRRNSAQLFILRRTFRRISDDRNEKIIDAEIVGEKKTIKYDKEFENRSKISSFLSKLTSKAQQVFGLDLKSKEERKRKQVINQSIDKLLEGTGVMGAVFGGVLKTLVASFQGSLAETEKDLLQISEAVERCLEGDPLVSPILGSSIRCDRPFSSSYRSMTVNGITSKSISLSMQVSGSQGTGQVSADAFVEPPQLPRIQRIIVTTSDGRVFPIRNGNLQGRGNIIDVDAV